MSWVPIVTITLVLFFALIGCAVWISSKRFQAWWYFRNTEP
jgi:hypothetical protein